MRKEQILLQLIEKCNSSKNPGSRNRGRMSRLVSAMLLVAVVLAAMMVLPVRAKAEVQFDGNKCYLSQNPENMRLTNTGYLRWLTPGEQQLVVCLPEIRLSEIGDIAEFKCLLRVDGPPQNVAASKQHTKAEDPCPKQETVNFYIGE
ncbi:MAG: hypothetical protein ACYTBV_03455 [Planctomycetota bacterium]